MLQRSENEQWGMSKKEQEDEIETEKDEEEGK